MMNEPVPIDSIEPIGNGWATTDSITRTNNNYCFRVPIEIRQQASAIFAKFGLHLSDALNIFLRQAIMCNGFPFELKTNMGAYEIKPLSSGKQLPPPSAQAATPKSLPIERPRPVQKQTEPPEPKPEEGTDAKTIEAAVQLIKALKALK